MGALKFIFAIFAVMKDPKAAAASLAMAGTVAGGGMYMVDRVDAKHDVAMREISKNKQSVNTMITTQQVILTKLEAIKDGIDDTKVQVKDLDKKVWQVILKNK